MTNKVLFLDGIRGWAAFSIYIWHIMMIFFPSMINGNLAQAHLSVPMEFILSKTPFVYNGNFYVCIFFVLSAYVLSYNFFLSRKCGALLSMIAKRYVRLVIPVFVSVMLAYLLLEYQVIFNKEVVQIAGSLPIFHSVYLFEASLWAAIREGIWGCFFEFNPITSYNPVLWTIGMELKGSVMLFCFLYFFGASKLRFPLYALAIVVFSGTYYLPFVFGIVLSDLSNSKECRGRFAILKDTYVAVVCFFVGGFLGAYELGGKYLIFEWMNFLVFQNYSIEAYIFYQNTGAFFLIMAVVLSSRLQRFFLWPFFCFMGKISYSFYLVHIPILSSVACYWFLCFYNRGYDYAVSVMLSVVLSSPILFLVSYFMSKYVDTGAVRLARMIGEFFSNHDHGIKIKG